MKEQTLKYGNNSKGGNTLINKKNIEYNKDVLQFFFDMITLHSDKSYGASSLRNRDRLYKALEEGGHFTDKTSGLNFYIFKPSRYGDNYVLEITEKQGWSNYYHKLNMSLDDIKDNLRGN